MKQVLITKASGEQEYFSGQKLEKSLRNAGADEDVIERISTKIADWIVPGVTTKKIYSEAFKLLRRERTASSAKYKLKQAIMELGPTGYPFEQFIGQIFERKGYTIEVGVVVDGNCVTHEMDVIATDQHTQHLMECKYSTDQGKQVSVQVPLYVRSRVDDIIRKREKDKHYQSLSFSGWVVTNTRFSSDSLSYGRCAGLNLLAWDYPAGKGLKDLVDEMKIYPLTVLHHLSKQDLKGLFKQDIVTCSQLLNNTDAINSLGIKDQKKALLMKELGAVCD
ncbi:MAG TPA: hypothetical protein VJ939_03310 [Bacteroidales bacterium]|nr:hypothetical protein [Bacteroidales bacterium]